MFKKELDDKSQSIFARFARGNVAAQHGSFLTSPMTLDSSDPEVMKQFIQTRTQVQESFIRETEKTRRTALWLAAALLGISCLTPVFAPAGREVVSYWVSAALFIFAAGAAGFSALRIKGLGQEILASSEQKPGSGRAR